MQNIKEESDFNINGGLYAVKFWAEWCQPCLSMNPTIHKLEKEFDDVNFLSINIDEVPSLAQKYKIRSIPTLITFKDGEEESRVVGLSLIKPLRKLFREFSV
jgi:thioredoxin 1